MGRRQKPTGTAKMKVPFNKPFVAGKELYYVAQAVVKGNLAGDGFFTQACSRELESQLDIGRVLLTPSCTAALEMAALLCSFKPGDEVILPSYTFVSTATAFVRAGAIPVFADIRPDTLNLDETKLVSLITPRTKAICVVHYGGVACEMDEIARIANEHHLVLIEDAAQGVNAYYDGRALGSIADLACFSFHETKNFICGEGGALCINRLDFLERAEILRDKGTNRQRFFRGEVDKYTWVDIGSSYVLSELCSAFLYGQLEQMSPISDRREKIYRGYLDRLYSVERYGVRLPIIPDVCQSNYHLFHLILPTPEIRDSLLRELREIGIQAVFHYVPLHSSPVGVSFEPRCRLDVTDDLSRRLIRLPFFHDMTDLEQEYVCENLLKLLERACK
jgi:dTDP-4-amino-4,6-dideoxygalactose transaminase